MKPGESMRLSSCCMICAWQLPVRVVNPEGHIRSLARPVTVAELLRHHPHHFLCEPSSTGPLFHSAMLPLDMELQEGRLYLLLPLPRLLPHLSGGPGVSLQCCPCFQNRTTASERRGSNRDIKRWFVRIQGHLLDTLRLSVVRLSRRALPERVRMRLSFHKLNSSSNFASKGGEDAKPSDSSSVQVQQQMCTSRNRWRPGLERISEVDLLLLRHDSEVMIMR